MLNEILPPLVCAAETTADLLDVSLYPEEEAAVARAVPKRRREFITVRACARTALAGLGCGPSPLIPGERGAPGWPSGVVGSMTHCDGYRAAAVAMAEHMVTVGIDAEEHAPLPDGILAAVSSPRERAHLAVLAARSPRVHWDRLLFSAKESVYKAWFPLTRRFLEFEEAEVEFAADGTFGARLLVPCPVVAGARLRGFTGRWLTRDGIALTAIAVPR
ncbi:4'-phosphopantetheinyl transferase superfamily protein [Actinoplanes sp. DH11]|uniref:4'-phosphopantetheinyl transferase family protein n=1 Tax=Actinoplanes sp. DH11 TaxID=2857011 RepID=UPI001E3DF967|nr:4'-phosphopantetheinyl transferase superfamily protein [Actinoplanes sp. DH11]